MDPNLKFRVVSAPPEPEGVQWVGGWFLKETRGRQKQWSSNKGVLNPLHGLFVQDQWKVSVFAGKKFFLKFICSAKTFVFMFKIKLSPSGPLKWKCLTFNAVALKLGFENIIDFGSTHTLLFILMGINSYIIHIWKTIYTLSLLNHVVLYGII